MHLRNTLFFHSVRSALIAVFAIVTFSFSSSIHAQDVSNDATAANNGMEEIVVTGSRIRRTNESSSIPLQIFNATDIEVSGTDDLAEALQQIPGVSSSISPQSSNNSIQTSGLSTVSLRRLGDDRTLVLINGKRAVSNSGNADRVSLSTLPRGFVDTTEVTTGGASAIYGSDAIAGVANFILEDDFEGLRLGGRSSMPEASGGDETRLEGLFGTKFSDDRGYLLFGLTYRDEEMIRADSTRPLSVLALEFDDPSTSSSDDFANERARPGCDGPNEDRHCFLPSFDDDTPGGVFEGDAWFRDGQWFNDRSLNPGDRTDGRDFFADFDGHRFRPGRTLTSSREILNSAVHGTFEFTPTIKGSATAMFSTVDSTTAGGFETLDPEDPIGSLTALDPEDLGNISSSHPFIPPEVEETRSGSVSFDRLLVELGEQQRINERNTTRIMADLKGEIWNDFVWEAYTTYGTFEQKQNNPNEYNILNAQFALDIEEDGSGGFQCEDAAARAAGCVPLNIFGEGTITPEAADYIRYNGRASQTRDQFTLGGFVSGDLFDVAAGPVQAVFGLEYRKEEQETFGDPDGDPIGGVDGDPTTEDFNITSLAVFPSVAADYDVIEAFTEFDIPVITDKLNVTFAARFSDYDTVGSIASYNAGAVWRPTNALQFRTQYSRSQRAPSITEFFSPPRQDSDGLDDVCDGLEFDQDTGEFDTSGIDLPSGSGGENADLATVRANCADTTSALNAGIHAWLADPENEGDEFDGDGSVQGPNAGARIVDGVRQLKEETADTFTIGFAYSPEFIPGLTIISDYYSIEIEDNIDSISTQNDVDLCYSASDFPTNRFCETITRNPFNGDVVEVINYQENLDSVTVEGIDVSANYEIEFDRIGEFEVDLRYTHYLTEETTFVGINDTVVTSVDLGEIESPEDELRFRLGYEKGDFRISYTMNYESGGIDDINGDRNEDDDRFYRISGTMYHRVYASYEFGEDDQYRIFGGVNNIEDNHGHFLPTGLDSGSSRNIVSDANDPVGREIYLGFRADFGRNGF